MADDTDLNLDDLEEDEVRATDSKEEDIEEIAAQEITENQNAPIGFDTDLSKS